MRLHKSSSRKGSNPANSSVKFKSFSYGNSYETKVSKELDKQKGGQKSLSRKLRSDGTSKSIPETEVIKDSNVDINTSQEGTTKAKANAESSTLSRIKYNKTDDSLVAKSHSARSGVDTRRLRSRRITPRTFSLVRRIQRSKHVLRKSLKSWRRTYVVVGLGVVVLSLWFLGTGVRVSQINYVGEGYLFYSPSEYENVLSASLAEMGSPRNSSSVLFESDKVSNNLQRLIDVQSVDVRKSILGRSVEVTLTIEAPPLIWQSGGEQFLVYPDGSVDLVTDESTVATSQRAKEQGIPFVEDSADSIKVSSLGVRPNEAVISPSLLLFINKLMVLSRDTPQVTIDKFKVGDEPFSVSVIMDELGGTEVKFYSAEDLDPQFNTLIGAALHLSNSGAGAEYIDVRVPGRAVYK